MGGGGSGHARRRTCTHLMERQALQKRPVAAWQRLHSVLPRQSAVLSRLEQRRQSGSPHSFFWRQKWHVMPAGAEAGRRRAGQGGRRRCLLQARQHTVRSVRTCFHRHLLPAPTAPCRLAGPALPLPYIPSPRCPSLPVAKRKRAHLGRCRTSTPALAMSSAGPGSRRPPPPGSGPQPRSAPASSSRSGLQGGRGVGGRRLRQAGVRGEHRNWVGQYPVHLVPSGADRRIRQAASPARPGVAGLAGATAASSTWWQHPLTHQVNQRAVIIVPGHPRPGVDGLAFLVDLGVGGGGGASEARAPARLSSAHTAHEGLRGKGQRDACVPRGWFSSLTVAPKKGAKVDPRCPRTPTLALPGAG